MDPETGRILGYARWRLPPSHRTSPDDGTPIWPEAQVPAVEAEKEAEIRRIAETVVWDPNDDADVLLDRVNALEKEVTPKKSYISKLRIGVKYLLV